MKIQNPTITQITELTGNGANLTGSFSGSIDASSFAGDGLGIVSGSAQTIAHLPAGTVSGSAQVVTLVEAGTDSNTFTDADHTKLNGIEASADVTDTENVTAAGALMDSEVSNLADVKSFDPADYATAAQGNTADSAQQPPAEGAFVDGDKTKLDGIEASADVTDTENVTAAGALMDSEVDADIKTLSLPANTTISTFGKSLVDDADAAAARTTLGVDAAGTDNSTDVTLAGSRDYITLSGQEITVGQIDISDDTNLAVSDTTGQTGVNMSLTGDTLSGVVSGLGTSATPTFSGLTVSNNVTINGDLTVLGDVTELQVSALNVEDINITIASGAADSSAANGAGITIDGANESLTWDHGNSRFTFSDDLNVGGNITLTGTVDGRDVATDGTKLDGIESDATADQTAAEIRTLVGNATDSNVFTDADHTKLDGIEANADVTDTENVTAAGAVMDSEVDADIKTLSLPANTTISSFGATLVDDADAAAGRTTLGLGTAATTAATDYATAAQGTTANNALPKAGGQMTGNITFSGAQTVDGRDLSADGTKLDGIETGATADQTLADLSLDTTDDVQFDSFGVGTAASGTTGEIRATGDITAFYSSDERLKENFAPLTGALDKVKAIGGYEFDWKDGIEDVVSKTGHDIGVKAQELQVQYPELVHERDNGYLAVDYIKLNAVLIEAVKELAAKVDELSK